MTSKYLVIVPIIIAVLLVGKAIEGTRFSFVFLIATLTIVNNTAWLVYDSTFICQGYRGPLYNNTDEHTYEYFNWNYGYVVVYYLSTE